ncbi:hemagglutinin repeat-containing protein, partial [uncultured Actinobacillus sp.]|uniref:two-partner secretion domain-containing protein n=2 Tax=Actinobacillus TaxID=713 RepID=UPI0025D8A969
MNKTKFRVIFNRTLSRLVVTSELAKTADKSSPAGDGDAVKSAVRFCSVLSLSSLSFRLFCALGLVSFIASQPAFANLEIRADKTAPVNQQPIVLSTANGIPQVNIQTPNSKGLSHNKYAQFDVAEKGAILNNSRTTVQTRQGGLVAGNPYLARGEARVILNEVNAANPSQLRGYVEVAGKKADVIIANPNGIHCDGCGVINSGRTTLTTGKPQIQNGQVTGFDVEKGKVKVSGKGLDNSRVNYTEILAREAEINAGIWSNKKLTVITGENQIQRSETAATPNDDDHLKIIHTKPATNSTPQPEKYAVDMSELGGMYAGKIYLIGTEQGLGVRNAGHIGASAGEVHIDSQGRIVNKGTVNANQNIQLTGKQGIENTGKIENSEQDIQLSTQADIQQHGSVVARNGNIHQTANQKIHQQGETIAKGNIHYKAPTVTASTSSLIAAGVETKDIPNGETRTLETASTQGKNLTVTTTGKTTLQGKNLASGKIQVNATDINLNQSQSAANFIDISATQGDIQANNATIIAHRDLTLTTPKTLQTQNSTVKTQGDLTVNATGFNNQQGRFVAEGQLTIHANNGKVDSTQGILASKQDLRLTSGELVNEAGLIQSYQNININTQGQRLSNQQTLTEAQDKGIVALGNLTLQTAILNNQQGGIYSADTAAITASQRINNQQGELLSANAIYIKNNGNLMVNNQNGLIQGQNTIDLTAKGLETEGTIKTAGNLSIDLKDSFTLNQAFDVGNNLTFSTQGNFTNNVKQVVGNQAAFTANHILNPAHAEISSNRTLLNAATLTNYGLLDGQENIIKTRTLDNLGTGRIYGDHLAIQAESLNNLNQDEKSATIAARNRLDLGVGTLVNRDHSLIFSLGDIAIGGQLDENNQAKGYAKFIDNGSATFEALGNGDIKTQRLLNHDLYLKLGEYHTDEHIIEYAPANRSKRYALLNKDGGEGRFDLKNNSRSDSNSYFILNNGTRIASRYWMTWDYNRHTVTSTIEYRDPANILIGGNLSLSGADLENNVSNLSVGKTLLLGDSIFTRNENNTNLTAGNITLKNIDIWGTIDITDTGKWAGFGKERHRYGARGKKRWAVYGTGEGEINDVHPTQHFAFKKVLNEIGTEITGTNTQIAQQSTPSAVISGQVSALHPANLDQNMQPVIKTHLADIRLPQASLYKINPDAPNGYLVETDPTFTDRKQWLSSDYMFNALRHDHNYVQKRLGDGFYEQRLVNEQINQLTGRRFLDNYSSDFEQYKALMDSGIYYANKFNLSLGVGLTAQQMAELTSDMVWFVNKEVRLPSGKTLTVLTPQVYLVARNLDVTPQGALISAREIVGNINGDIQNSGTVAGGNLTALSAKNIQNYGVVLGDTVNLNVEQRLVNLGGKIQALNSATLLAGQGVDIASQTSRSANTDSSGNAFAHTAIDRQADIHAGGKLTIYSPKDVTVKAANLSADIIHIQGNQVELGIVTTHNKQHYNGDGDNYYRLDQTQEVGSQLTAKNDVNILSENLTALRQAGIHSDNGTVTLSSTNGDVQIQEGRNQEQLSFGAKSTHHGTLQTITSVTKHDHRYDSAQGSAIDGNNVVLQANNGNVSVQGSNVVAENHLVAKAKNISIQAAENRVFEEDFEKRSKSGLMGSGGFGFSVGSKKEKVEQDRTQESAASSQVGSLKGDTVLHADNHYQQTGSVVTAVNGDVDILAKSANITAAHSDYESNYKYTMEQKGVTIALTGAVVSAIQAADSTLKSAKTIGSSKNNRINAMATANTVFDAVRTAEQLKGIADAISNGSTTGGAIGVSITYGQQKTVQTQHTEGNTVAKSAVNAGGKVNIVATGLSEQSNIDILGSDVSGQAGTHLKADGDINIQAVDENHLERSKNKSSGFNIGVGIQLGKGIAAGLTVGGNVAKGYGNGESQAWVASQVGDKNSQTTIESGKDTNIIGSQVIGKRVEVSAENLNIESLQDTAKYDGKQESISGSATIGYGFSAGGSYSKSKVNS